MTSLFDRLRQAVGIDLDEQELTGGVVSGEIPLTNEVVNRFIAARLAASQGTVAGARVDAQQDDRFTVDVTLRAPLPTISVAVQIEQQPQFPHQAALVLRWSVPGLGPLALLAGPALAFFKGLPPGLQVEGDRLTVDLGGMLRSRGHGDLVRFVSNARLHTRPGAFLLRFELRVPTAEQS